MADSNTLDQIVTFLDMVITGNEGYFCMSLFQSDGIGWTDQWYLWPKDKHKIAEQALNHADKYNVYFSTYLFCAPNRTKPNVLPTRTIQADLDEADLANIPISPSVLIQTSPGRHQAFWILQREVDLESHEILSRKITYAIDKADHSGWPIGHTARMPFTFNYKYIDGPYPVNIVTSSGEEIDSVSFELLPDIDKPNAQEDQAWIAGDKTKPKIGPNELLDKLRQEKKLVAKLVIEFNAVQRDRSAALWALMLALFRASCDRDTVFWIAKQSANNKFSGLRYGGDKELAKDVLRAESVAQRKITDVRAAIREIRRLPGVKFLMHSAVASTVMDVMRAEGDFIHTTDNNLWYVKRDTGKPINLARNSEYFVSLLDIHFGLNRSEAEQTYTKDAITSYTVNMPAETEVGAISYYNQSRNILMLHTGMRDVQHISKTAITKLPNGSGGILFPWNMANEPFIPDFNPLPDNQTWQEIMFAGAFDNVVNMTKDEAMALMQVWTMFILFRKAAATRPVLAFLGQPGSGKTTIMKRIYRLLYGRNKDLLKARVEEHLDIASTADPFIGIDNVDTWQSWLPDWLATAISNMDIPKRKLYTDGDLFNLKRQAIIGVTAHNPKFGREDVADRLLLITFRRIPYFGQESKILDNITINRNKLWGAILQDAQKVLQEPFTTHTEAPQFRIEDFSIVGLRIARALGVAKDFCSAINAVAAEQKLFSLEEEHILVSAIKNMVTNDTKRDRTGMERTSGVLWSELEAYSGNVQAFQRLYRNAVVLSKKLSAMQDPLSQIFIITSRIDSAHGSKLWSFVEKEGIISADQLTKLKTIEAAD